MKTDFSDYGEKKPTSHNVPGTPQQNSWAFKVLITVITLCVLLLVGKVLGLF